jgi:hypothetical protein
MACARQQRRLRKGEELKCLAGDEKARCSAAQERPLWWSRRGTTLRGLASKPITEHRSERFASVLFPPWLVTATLKVQVLEMGNILAEQVASCGTRMWIVVPVDH